MGKPLSLFLLLNTQNTYCHWILCLKKAGIKQQSPVILTPDHVFLRPVTHPLMYVLSYYCIKCRKDLWKYLTIFFQGCDVGSHVSSGNPPSPLPSRVPLGQFANTEFTFPTAFPFPQGFMGSVGFEKSVSASLNPQPGYALS